MVGVISYLAGRFIFRVFEFLEHWYWGSFRVAGGKLIDLFRKWDRFFALKITVRYWLQPLYQDRTIIGYILGPIFRTGRIVVATLIYLLTAALAALLYFIWLIIPPYIVYKILTGF
ncbi:MAG: hypothetical protein HYS88_02050 [Candidatus Colwellbacteria bacterium]|nr:hypothetical protein [Candidatus Colwellbacteria bacterium]